MEIEFEPAYSTELVPGQQGLHGETMFQKAKKQLQKDKLEDIRYLSSTGSTQE